MCNNTNLKRIYRDIDSLNSRKDWSRYCMDELMYDINLVHNALETLVEYRDSDEEMSLVEYNKLEDYIEVGSKLERTIDKAIIRLRCGYDVYVEWE